MTQQEFLTQMFEAAKAARHPYPDYAACEVAVDSKWDEDGLIASTRNAFAFRPLVTMPMKHTYLVRRQAMVSGRLQEVQIQYIVFEELKESFEYRVELLRRFSMYRDLRYVDDGEEYIMQISSMWSEIDAAAAKDIPAPIQATFHGKLYKWEAGRWSNDPSRASQVLEVYANNRTVFA